MTHNRAGLPPAFRLSFALILAIQAMMAGAFSVHAEEANQQVRLSIKPVAVEGSYYDLTMSPGETKQLAVELGNHGDSTISARSFAADVYTIHNGGFGAELDGEEPNGPTLWLDYPTDTFDLKPGMANVRTFTITVPRDAQPGDHITSLVIQNAVATQGSGNGVSLNQISRQAIAVAIEVPGERTASIAIGGVSYKDVGLMSVVAFDVSNTGNTHLKPAGELVLYDTNDTAVLRQAVAMDSFYARTYSVVEIAIPDRLAEGEYRATLSLVDAAHDARAETPSPLGLVVPKAVETIVVPAPNTAGVPVTQPVVTAAPASQPWLMVAVAVAGTLAAVGLGFGAITLFKRIKSRPTTDQANGHAGDITPASPIPNLVVATAYVKPAVVRPLVPPARRAESAPTRQPGLRPITRR